MVWPLGVVTLHDVEMCGGCFSRAPLEQGGFQGSTYFCFLSQARLHHKVLCRKRNRKFANPSPAQDYLPSVCEVLGLGQSEQPIGKGVASGGCSSVSFHPPPFCPSFPFNGYGHIEAA